MPTYEITLLGFIILLVLASIGAFILLIILTVFLYMALARFIDWVAFRVDRKEDDDNDE